MKSTYKRLGDYIRQVDVRNVDDKRYELLGVSVEKCFISSIANTVGTDWHNYKVIKKGQFCYIPDTSRRGDKIGIAHLVDREIGLVSAVYTVFEVWNRDLIPEYLMLWFKRPEFDRYARYHSHGSVREIFDWEEMCNVELPVPPIEEQQKIVDAYQTIEHRIALKKKINENLLSIGVYVIQKNVGKSILLNLDKDDVENLPVGCSVNAIANFCNYTKSGATPSRDNAEYWECGSIPWLKSGEVHNNITLQTEEYITEAGVKHSSVKILPENTVLMAMYGVTAGEVGYLATQATTNQAICGMVCDSKEEAAYLYFSLIQSQKEISRLSNGGAQDNLSKKFIDSINMIVPSKSFINKLNLYPLIKHMVFTTKEILICENCKSIILSMLTNKNKSVRE